MIAGVVKKVVVGSLLCAVVVVGFVLCLVLCTWDNESHLELSRNPP